MLSDSERKWGRYPPENRYNVDQVPLPFVVSFTHTFEQRGAERVWVRQYMSGSLEKRVATMQLCFSPAGKHVRAGIIFKGERTMNESTRTGRPHRSEPGTPCEADLWHPDIYVKFQPCAWADPAYSREWAQECFAADVDSNMPNTLYSETAT